MTKKQFLKLIRQARAFLATAEGADCPCPNTKCEWHGKCTECVRLHRHYGEHVPNCFQQLLQDKVREIASVAELIVTPRRRTPSGHWDYVRKVDAATERQKTAKRAKRF
jgi:hypothetical protein